MLFAMPEVSRAVHVPCLDCRLRHRSCFRPFSASELDAISAMKTAHLALPAKHDLVQAGEVGGALYTLYEGWAFRYKTLAVGGRQILDLVLPGEIVGLSSALLGAARHSVQTLTPASVCVLTGVPLPELLRNNLDLAFDLLRWRVEEEHRADIRLTLLGRCKPLQRVGYLMLELFDRLQRLELVDGAICPFPLQRQHLADATGLSMIHLNRTLTRLREDRLAVIEDKMLIILDRRGLAELSGYGGEPLTTHRMLL
jgi:CRP/FNR family transcriptional regulator, anaerobic regulatory protein